MTNFTKFVTIAFLLATLFSCSTESEEPFNEPDPVNEPVVNTDCPEILSSEQTMDINGEKHNFSIAQLVKSEGLFGDHYLFRVSGIPSDCNIIKTISFTSEIPVGSELNGTYDIGSIFFPLAINEVQNVTLKTVTVNPITQTLTEVISGTIELTKHDTRDYTVVVNGKLADGSSLDVEFRKAF